jgi:hypothetical protein
MEFRIVKVKEYHCLRCGKWFRSPKPKRCGKCKNPNWKTESAKPKPKKKRGRPRKKSAASDLRWLDGLSLKDGILSR